MKNKYIGLDPEQAIIKQLKKFNDQCSDTFTKGMPIDVDIVNCIGEANKVISDYENDKPVDWSYATELIQDFNYKLSASSTFNICKAIVMISNEVEKTKYNKK